MKWIGFEDKSSPFRVKSFFGVNNGMYFDLMTCLISIEWVRFIRFIIIPGMLPGKE